MELDQQIEVPALADAEARLDCQARRGPLDLFLVNLEVVVAP